MPDCTPFFEPGKDPTCVAAGAVTGCRFVQVKTGVNALNDLTQVETCGAGGEPFGVAARDKLDGQAVMVYRDAIVPVLAGAALSHGQRVQSDAQGRAIPLAGGAQAGICLKDAADATFAKIAIGTGSGGAIPAANVVGDQPAIADVASANATSPANVAYTQADQTALADLANELKAKFNSLLDELRDAGVLAP